MQTLAKDDSSDNSSRRCLSHEEQLLYHPNLEKVLHLQLLPKPLPFLSEELDHPQIVEAESTPMKFFGSGDFGGGVLAVKTCVGELAEALDVGGLAVHRSAVQGVTESAAEQVLLA